MERTRPVEAERARAETLRDTGRTGEALATLLAAADDIIDSNPAGAATLLVDAVQLALFTSGPRRALELAERALRLADGRDDLAMLRAQTRVGDALTWLGRHDEARAAWGAARMVPDGDDPAFACERANVALRAGELEPARDLAYQAVVRARRAESSLDLADALSLACVAEIHLGQLQEALGTSEQAMAVASSDGIARVDAIGLAAWATALLGDVPRCKELMAEAARVHTKVHVTAPGGLAAGMLAMGLGDYASAARAFESKATELAVSPVAQALGLRPYVPSLVEAYARMGSRFQATALLETFFEPALNSQQPRHVAVALRAKAAVDADPDVLAEALEWHARWGNGFEEGRTLLARGELLRRGRRVEQARQALRAALARFQRVGAITWHARAAAELRAAGDRTLPAPRRLSGRVEPLTEQEAAIAALVESGFTNREIAERIVVSVKTVERHLTSVYGKLGIKSRAQLVARLSSRPVDEAPSAMNEEGG